MGQLDGDVVDGRQVRPPRRLGQFAPRGHLHTARALLGAVALVQHAGELVSNGAAGKAVPGARQDRGPLADELPVEVALVLCELAPGDEQGMELAPVVLPRPPVAPAGGPPLSAPAGVLELGHRLHDHLWKLLRRLVPVGKGFDLVPDGLELLAHAVTWA